MPAPGNGKKKNTKKEINILKLQAILINKLMKEVKNKK